MQRIANPYSSVQFRDAPHLRSIYYSPDGGSGRHKGLKIPQQYSYVGSNPALGIFDLINIITYKLLLHTTIN